MERIRETISIFEDRARVTTKSEQQSGTDEGKEQCLKDMLNNKMI